MRRTRVRVGLAMIVTVMAAGPAALAGGGCHDPNTTEARGTAVDVGKNCFGPTVLRVDAGETVAWTNFDPIEHTITAAGGVFDEQIEPGETFTYRFTSAGVYPYYCLLHPRMAGAVVVDPAVSAAGNVTQPVASVAEPSEEEPSATSAALIACFIAAPLSFTAGRILRGRRRMA